MYDIWATVLIMATWPSFCLSGFLYLAHTGPNWCFDEATNLDYIGFRNVFGVVHCSFYLVFCQSPVHPHKIPQQVHHKENESCLFPAKIDIRKRWMEPLSFRSIMWLFDHWWVSLATTAATQRTRRTLDQPEAIAANRTGVNPTREDTKVLWKIGALARFWWRKMFQAR